MIRTVIEVSADEAWKHKQELESALDLLGFERKQSADSVRFMCDLHEALNEKGMTAFDLVSTYRDARDAKAAGPHDER